MALFDNINENFFKPLNSKYKYQFVDILMFLNETINNSGQMSMNRNDIRDALETYLYDKQWYLDFHDDEEFEIISEEIKSEITGFDIGNVSYILNYLNRYQWISIEQSSDDLSKIIIIPYSTRVFIDFILDLTQEREQVGYIIRIHASLQSIVEPYKNKQDMKDSYQHLVNAYADFQELIKTLEHMNAKIKEYYEKQLKTKMDNVLEEYIDEYYVGIIQKFIYPTLIDDSIRRFKGPIEDILDYIILEDDLKNAIQESAKTYFRIKDEKNAVLQKLMTMYSQLSIIENLTDMLVDKNSNYQQVAHKKIISYFNQDQSVKGLITEILQQFSIHEDTILLKVQQFLNYNPVQMIFQNQIADLNKKQKKQKAEPIDFSDEHVLLDNKKMNKFINYEKHSKFTEKKINEFFLSKMSDSAMDIRSVEIQGDDDYIRTILLFINNKVSKPVFEINMYKNRITKNEYELPGFTIKKRENEYEN